MTKDLSNLTKIEIITINENFIIQFIYIPNNYYIKKWNLEGFKTKKLGKLNSFNRLKLLKHWRKDNENLVEIFQNLLLAKGWDFIKFPNPTAYIAHKENNQK